MTMEMMRMIRVMVMVMVTTYLYIFVQCTLYIYVLLFVGLEKSPLSALKLDSDLTLPLMRIVMMI